MAGSPDIRTSRFLIILIWGPVFLENNNYARKLFSCEMSSVIR